MLPKLHQVCFLVSFQNFLLSIYVVLECCDHIVGEYIQMMREPDLEESRKERKNRYKVTMIFHGSGINCIKNSSENGKKLKVI